MLNFEAWLIIDTLPTVNSALTIAFELVGLCCCINGNSFQALAAQREEDTTAAEQERVSSLCRLPYSHLPLRHLVKADTSVKQTRGVGPFHTSVIYFIFLQGGHLLHRQSELVSSVFGFIQGVDWFSLFTLQPV